MEPKSNQSVTKPVQSVPPVQQPAVPAAEQQPVKPAQPVQPSQTATQPLSEKKAAGRKHTGVMLITRTQIFMYIEGVEKIVIYPFSVDVVRDLDIVNQQLLTEQLASLVKKNNLPPASFSVILGNATIFARQILSTDSVQKKMEEEKFMNTVPFEDVATQHIIMGQNTYLTAANKHFYESISKALESQGCEMSLVLPEFLFAKEINLSHGLTADSAAALLRKMPTYREYNLLKKEIIHDDQGGSAGDAKMKLQVKGGKSNRVFVLAGVFFMLIGVLIAVYLWVQQQNELAAPPPKPAVTQPVVTVVPLPVTASEEAVLISPSAPIEQREVQGAFTPTIQINHSSQNSNQANQLRARLDQQGYRGIILNNISSFVGTTRIIFKPSVPQSIRDIIIAEAKAVSGTVAVLQTSQSSSDVVITLR